MTPTEQDNELHSKSYKLAQEYLMTDNLEWFVALIQNNLTLDEALQLIIADRKRVALEARIDELQKALDENSPFGEGQLDIASEYAEWRIAKLKAQQEEANQ